MASGKRASMREGPLAALFRKTDEDGPEAAEGRPDTAGLDAPSREPRSTRTGSRNASPAKLWLITQA